LAFLVDILLFVPHMAWGGWIVLAATILIIASSVVTCAMRRTLVSRKARKKRIAENADMNGADYYNNLNQTRMMTDTSVPPVSTLPRADSPPPMSGTTAGDKGTPQFAAFETKNGQSRDGTDAMMGSTDDRTPLNPTRDPSIRSHSSNTRREYMQDVAPPMPMGRTSMDSQGRPRRDQYGNPIPPDMNMPLRHRTSDESFASRGSRGGRGGYGPAPRGYGAPRGGYPPRGGSYGPRGGFGGGPPPPGWNGRGRGSYGPPPPGMRAPRPAPPPGYSNFGNGPYDPAYAPGMRSGPSPTMEQPAPDAFVAGPMIGQAIEMDERTGSPAQPSSPNPDSYAQNYGLRDSDADVAGLVGLQQERRGSPMRTASERESGMRGPTSVYSSEQ